MEDTLQSELEITQPVETAVEIKPKKKVSGCLVTFLVFIGMFLLLIVGAYIGYRKISSDLKTQVDLNVRYTDEDVIDLTEIVKITPENYMDIKDGVDISFSSAQITAMLNAQSVSPTFSNTQIKFNKDNVQISTLAKFEFSEGEPFNLPLYVSANSEEFTRENFELDIQEIKIGLLRLPDWVQEKIAKTEEEWIAGVILEGLSSFEFESIRFTKDHVDIQDLLFGALK
ncbi:MAG TPA: hypothetical protein PKI16_00105 [Candidatus Dojkabacteria bacterium]|nr:hypothetical protein [Candidatus Dojkabacteria bacterium]